MKKITFILSFIVMAAIIATCDKIEGPYLQYDDSVDTTVEFPELDKASVYRKVFVAEFTGHRCSNCPAGHRLLNTLSGIYGDTLVAMCMHAGSQSAPTGKFPANFRTDEGSELFNDFHVSSIPCAIFNLSPYDGAEVVGTDKWAQAADFFSRLPAVAAIQMINEFSGSTLTAHTKTTFLSEYANPVKLALYVMEDGIVSPQIDGTDTIADYVHNHMMRGSLNGTYGTFISDNGNVAADTGYTKSYQLSCAGKQWDFAHCSVVAVLMDATTKEVLQVEKRPFLNE